MDKDINHALLRLSYREREIIKLRYGLGENEVSYTMEEVGHIFKVTRERIRRIQLKAEVKLADMGITLEKPYPS